MHTFLSLESRQGDREAVLVLARDLLMKHDVLVMGQSSVIELDAALGQVVECQTELSSEELIVACKAVEREMAGETRGVDIGNVQFGQAPTRPQVVDIKVLIYGDRVLTDIHPLLKKPLKELSARA